MTSRDITASVKAEFQADGLAPVLIGSFDYGSGVLRAWSGIGDLIWAGNTYLGVGHLLSVSPVSETVQLKAEGVQFKMTGIPQARLAQVLGEDYQGRPAKLWIGVLDTAGNLIADPVMVLDGRMDTVEIDEGGDAAIITQHVESELIDLRRPRTSRYTDVEQKALYPGDRGLEFVASLQDQVILWGR